MPPENKNNHRIDMSDKPTTTALKADEALLRLTIGKVLNPDSWKHGWVIIPPVYIGTPNQNWVCRKCPMKYRGPLDELPDSPCPVPDSATEPMPVLAEQLVQKCLRRDLSDEWETCYCLRSLGIGPMSGLDGGEQQLHWWLMADPAVQAICALVALKEAVVG